MRNNNSFYSIYCNFMLITLSTIIILASSSLFISWSGSKAFLYMMTHGNTVLLNIILFMILMDGTLVKKMKTVTTNKMIKFNKFLKTLTVIILLITLLMIIIVSYSSFFTSWGSETFLDIVQQEDTLTIWLIAYMIPFIQIFGNTMGKDPVQKD